MSEDEYIYISVKLYLKAGQTMESVQEIVQEMDYSFAHKELVEHEIIEITDTSIEGEV
tara:strand:- start:3318 stop:3491 length:174 start_codon:yes stop_codon:yes gene_type:complete